MDFILDTFADQAPKRGDVVDGAVTVCGRCPGSYQIALRLAPGNHVLVDLFARGATLNRWP